MERPPQPPVRLLEKKATQDVSAVIEPPGDQYPQPHTPIGRETAIYIVWGAGVTAGTIVIESAHSRDYTGTWANMATVAWSSESREDLVQITGVMAACRVRISSTITNGTIDAWALTN